jgi:DNA primase
VGTGLLPDEVIAEIRDRVDMVALVAEYVRLTKRGSNHVGLCPFHAEKTPSFNVSAANKFFHCFGCKESGDPFAFVMRMEGTTFPQAARSLAERCGVVIPELDRAEDAAEQRERKRREQLCALMEEACKFYQQKLADHPHAHVARTELEQRNVQTATAEKFRLGYAPHAWDALGQHLASKGYSAADAETVGLLARRKSGSGHYDRFRGRLMFPVRELGGQVVAFSGRILPPPEGALTPAPQSDNPEPKYVNSPESPLYHKGDVLFGLHEARVEVRRNGWALLCEGNFDLLALHQAGFGNALAPLGTAFTANQAKLVARFAQRVTLLFDGDAAGQKAVRAACPLLQQTGLRGSVARLPPGQDPDSFARAAGAEGLQRLVHSAQGILEYLIDAAAEQAGASAGERAAALVSLTPLLQAVDSPVEMELYVERAAQRFGLPDTASVRRELRRGQSTQATSPERRNLAPANQYGKLPGLQRERELLGVLLDRPALFQSPEAARLEGLLGFELRTVFGAAASAVQESGALDLSALFSALGDHSELAWVKERLALQTYRDRDDFEEALRNGIQLLIKERPEQERGLKQQILEARRSGVDELAVRLTRQREELRRSAAQGQLRRER